MKTRTLISLAVVTLAAALVAPAAAGAAPKRSPLFVRTFQAPIPVTGTDGKRHLAYELMLQNATGVPLDVQSVAVRAHGRRLLGLQGAGLQDMMLNYTGAHTTRLGASDGALIWLDVVRPRHGRLPRMLVHRVTASATVQDGSFRSWTFDTARTRVQRRGPVVLSPPLRGGLYMDFNGCCDLSPHRMALTAMDGGAFLSERYATDLIKVDENGVGGAGDLSRNESFFTYGEPVHAVADAKVVDTLNTVQDNVPLFEPPSDAFTERTIMGNLVTLKLGPHRYATYMHLKPGSLRVHRGQRVHRGDVIAQVGNTGQSGGAHLHIQVTDRRNPLASTGLPFVFDSFRLVGHVPNIDQFLTGQAPADIHRDGRTGRVHGELPLQDSVLRFAQGG